MKKLNETNLKINHGRIEKVTGKNFIANEASLTGGWVEVLPVGRM